ncbi:hypothetical protein CHUAL_002593 [Chamberlinius hualienensis]
MAFLFGNSASRSQSKNLLEFRAGKMNLKGNMVHPDKRKGLVYVHQTEDSLMHFCWKDRGTGTVEDDLIIFPDDVEFKKVAACTTGRVYVMKFKSTNRKFFFWMQEPKTDKDEEYCQKVNDFLNNPPAPGSGRSGGSTPGGANVEHSERDLQNLFSAMNQQQFMQLLGMGGVGSMANLSSLLGSHELGSQFAERSSSNQSSRTTANSSSSSAATTVTTTATTTVTSPSVTSPSTTSATATATPSTTTTTNSTTSAAPQTTSSSGIQLADVQNILSGITAQSGKQESPSQAVDLSRGLTTEVLQPLMTNSEFLQRVKELLPNLGSNSENTPEQLRSTVQSPQFRQAFSTFSAALSSGQLGPIMHQFGFGEEVEAAAAQGDLEAFLQALQQTTQNKDGADKTKDKKKDDDDEMALD